MKWWLKFLFICSVFGVGAWFGNILTTNHYERVLAEESTLHAQVCQVRVEEVLQQISLKFCAAWNVSVPPYDKSVAEFINEEDQK